MSPRGGPREGAGRPATTGDQMLRVHIYISQDDLDYLKSKGNGNICEGARKVIAGARKKGKK